MLTQHKPTLFNEGKLKERASESKLQPFKLKQIFHELYKNQNTDWDSMTTLSKDLKAELQKDFDLLAIELIEMVEAPDTTKFAFKTRDGNIIEAICITGKMKNTSKTTNQNSIVSHYVSPLK